MWYHNCMETTRKCSRCQIVKSLAAFHKRPNRPGGRHYACRSCISEQMRKPLPTLKDIPLLEIGRLVGLIDGEGSFCFNRQRERGREHYSLQIRVFNTHRGVLEGLVRFWGGVICMSSKRRALHHKQGYFWCASTRLAIPILKLVGPHLVIKRRHGEVVMAIFDSIWGAKEEARNAGQPVTATELTGPLGELVAELRLLNRRGPDRGVVHS